MTRRKHEADASVFACNALPVRARVGSGTITVIYYYYYYYYSVGLSGS